jgi:hypothetical protein
MSVIASDGLSLLVGDGGTSELFATLKGAAINMLEISQRAPLVNAVATDAWAAQAAATNRQLVLECDAYATDDAATLRMRALAFNGAKGNFKLEVSPTESLQFAATVMRYREVIEQGVIKKLMCRLESSGAVTVLGA